LKINMSLTGFRSKNINIKKIKTAVTQKIIVFSKILSGSKNYQYTLHNACVSFKKH